MPYIKKEDREELKTLRYAKTAGELNYLFTKMALRYIKDRGESYQHYNDIIGALEGCKLELYRRKIGDYENVKSFQNGDVF